MSSRTLNVTRSCPPMASLAGAIVLACATTMASVGQAAEVASPNRNPVEDLRVVLLQAIDAPDGQAHAVLVGALAEAITAKFKATSPIFVDVSTLKRHSQEGCRRLRLALWQDGVVLPGALGANGQQRRTVAFDLNYCRDGSPPASLS